MLAAKSDLALELIGKRVGDLFVLAKSPIQDRKATIVQILSKYTRRFQAVGNEMQLRFAGQSVIYTMRMPSAEKLTAADLQPILNSVKSRAEAASKLREFYRSTAITLHMYGDQFGHTAYEAILDLATTDDEFVRCAPSQVSEFAAAAAALRAKSTVVLDVSALGTLRLLDMTRSVLTTTAFRFVMSPATFTVLQQMRAESRFVAPSGTMFYKDGQHYMSQTTAEQREGEKAAFEDWLRCVETNTTVVPVPELASWLPERRQTIEDLIGRYGLESAVLARSPGSTWWTDDLVAAESTKSEIGFDRVWTQAVLEHLASLGVITRSAANEAYAKLVGLDYQSTLFNAPVIIAGLRLANGSISAFPMRQLIRAFQPLPSNDRNAAFRLLSDFAVKLSVEPMLPETKCVALKALLDGFPEDANTLAQFTLFRAQCSRLTTLNPLAQADVVTCLDQWIKDRWPVNPFGPARR